MKVTGSECAVAPLGAGTDGGEAWRGWGGVAWSLSRWGSELLMSFSFLLIRLWNRLLEFGVWNCRRSLADVINVTYSKFNDALHLYTLQPTTILLHSAARCRRLLILLLRQQFKRCCSAFESFLADEDAIQVINITCFHGDDATNYQLSGNVSSDHFTVIWLWIFSSCCDQAIRWDNLDHKSF